MATFADMMTLLLCFFVLLLSFATMDVVKFRDAMGSVQRELGVVSKQDGMFEALATSPIQLDENEATAEPGADRALLEELQAAISEEGLGNEMTAQMDGRGVIVRISGRVLYPQGSAGLRPESDTILRRISELVQGTEHRVMIEGHTDDVPIATLRYPSNWELSTARAISGMQYLVEHGVDAERVGVAGYADQRPLEGNDTPERRAANRRVEFVFIRQTDDAAVAEDQEPGTDEASVAEDQGTATAVSTDSTPADSVAPDAQ